MPTDLRQAILDHVGRSNYQPVKPRVIAKKLGLDEDGARELKKLIKQLVKQGELQYGSNHLVVPRGASKGSRKNLPADADCVTGVFRRMAAGYGFVRPAGVPLSSGKSQDIHVSAKNAGDASTGDTVLVRLHKQRWPKKPGPSGDIIRILERETNRFVGTYFEQGGMPLVQIDGKLFSQPILVGDPGAKSVRPNDKVVIEMVRFPSHSRDGEGVIVDVLGASGSPGVDTLSIIHEYNLPQEFSEDVLEDARKQADRFDASLASGRTDLTGATVITIDPKDARDFDDAISLTRDERGHWELGVHIADVSHFVRPKTALDREARDRATSVYLPDRVIPMLPEVISNNLASLQPNRVRYCMTAVIHFSPEGLRLGCDVFRSAIKSKRRFSYEEVDDYLAKPAAWEKKLRVKVHSLLGRMHELAMILRRRRFQRGALELSMPEVKVDLDRDGRVTGAHLVEHTESHQIIEEFMLAANEAVAEKLHDATLVFLRRIHESPDLRKLKALTEFVNELGLETESLESRFAIQKLLGDVEGLPQEHAVNYAVLRSMQKAVYGPNVEGHYALASECYCHFTSPIRRYPDLTVHRLCGDLLAGKSPVQDVADLVAEGDHCSQREQRAEEAERELTKVKLLNYLSERIGEELDGIITGVEDFGLFIQGVELPAEGFVHIGALADDYYHHDRTTHSLAGHRSGNSFRLGDMVRVAVAAVDVGRRKLDFRLLEKAPAQSRKSRIKKKARRGAKKKTTVKKKSPAKRKTKKKKPAKRKKKRRS